MGASRTDSENLPRELTEGLERLLGAGELSGWITAMGEDEYPLRGIAATLDWRYHGAISQHLQSGALAGKAGECAYIPVTRADRVHHLFVVGRGKGSEVPAESLALLRRNLSALKLPKPLGAHGDDLGRSAVRELEKQNLSLWVI